MGAASRNGTTQCRKGNKKVSSRKRHSRRDMLCRRERLTRKGNFTLHVGLIDFLYSLVFSARVVPSPFRDGCEWFSASLFVRP
jgi:hypothetical protein